ncbi:MAG: GNAT family N-acetyltransferase [Planctomycetales bacterium]|nr:GNAT family N-acetyltransferase [Planctomycetales bacterium]
MTFHLREACEADIAKLAHLHVQTFNETHCGGQPGGPSYELRASQWSEAFKRQDSDSFCYVIEDHLGELVGFASGRPHDGSVPGYAGELNKIYLLKRIQRQGLGRQLLCAVARRFSERGINSMLLFGEATNPSNGFYEAFGAERLYSDHGEFHGGYGWRDLSALLAQSRI